MKPWVNASVFVFERVGFVVDVMHVKLTIYVGCVTRTAINSVEYRTGHPIVGLDTVGEWR